MRTIPPSSIPALALLLAPAAAAQSTYYPPPEGEGGWRSLVTYGATPSPAQKQTIAGTVSVDWDALADAWSILQPHGGGFLVIREGWVVGEWGIRDPLSIASGTKSLTSLAMQRLYDMSDAGLVPVSIDEDDAAWQFLPGSWSTGQPAKMQITLRHLSTMTSGLEPDDAPVQTAQYKARVLSLPVEDPPDTVWVYASAPVDLLSLVVEDVTEGTLAGFFQAEIGDRIGLGPTLWGTMGSSTVGSAYCLVSPRDVGRIAYLLLRDGRWNLGSGEQQVVSAPRVRKVTELAPPALTTSFATPNNFANDPESNLRYGHLFWATNLDTPYISSETHSKAFYMAGFGTCFCVAVPEYDLIVVRLGSFPRPWDDELFVGAMDRVMEGVLDRDVHARVTTGLGGCGPANTPRLFSTPPLLGSNFTVSVLDQQPGSSSLLLYGFASSTPVPVTENCSLGLEQPVGYAAFPGGSTSLALPPSPALGGIEFAVQAVVNDGSGTRLTNAVELTLGS